KEPVSPIQPLGHESLDFLDRTRIQCPTQLNFIASPSVPALHSILPKQLSGQIKQRQVNTSLADRLAGRKRRRDNPVHGAADAYFVEDLQSYQLRRQVFRDRAFDRLDGLITPPMRGNALSPPHGPVISRNLDHHRWPRRR